MRRFLKRCGVCLATLWFSVHGTDGLTSVSVTNTKQEQELRGLKRLTWEPADCIAHRERQENSLRESLQAATTPLQQAQAQLAWANWLLADAAACPATRWLLGFERHEDASILAAVARQAGERLDQAREILHGISPASLNDEDKRRRNRLLEAADTLEPFTRFFAVLAKQNDTATYKTACADAAIELSATREADEASVAACARLWQSLGWAMADRRDRALLSLAPSLKTPEQFPYDFFSRLLRCRIALDQEQYAAVTALAIQMRQQMEPWFRNSPSPERLKDAQRLVALLQYRAQSLWLKQLRESSLPEANHMEPMLAELEKQYFPEGATVDVYCLEHAVPLIVELPEINRSSAQTVTRPASTPTTSATSQPATASDPE